MPRPFRTSCFSFFSLRFSLSVLPDFFDATFRGDLSAMSTPFLRGILLPFGGARRHRMGGGRVTGKPRPPRRYSENMVNIWGKARAS